MRVSLVGAKYNIRVYFQQWMKVTDPYTFPRVIFWIRRERIRDRGNELFDFENIA